MGTHFNTQRHLYDDQFSLARTPAELEQRQGRLIPLTPQGSLVVYRAKSPKRRVPHVSPPPQWLLFEVVAAG
jgi:hypothetical protein